MAREQERGFEDVTAAIRSSRDVELMQPSAHVWDAIAAATQDSSAAGHTSSAIPSSSVPPAAHMPAAADSSGPEAVQGTTEANHGASILPLGSARRGLSRWQTGVLAAACLGAAVFVGYSIPRGSSGAPPQAAPTTTVTITPTFQPIAEVSLDTLDTKASVGQAAAQRSGDVLSLHVSATVEPPETGYLEVWLINVDGKRMVSLGVLSNTAETLPISQTLLDQGYRIVDISREQFDDKPQHSGDSLMRGELPTA